MEWNGKWEWENLDIFGSKACESRKKLQTTTDWGIEDEELDAGSFNLSGGCGGSASDLGHVSSAKSSISASTECSSKEGMQASNFTFESFGGLPEDFSKKNDLTRAELTGTSPSLKTPVGSGDVSIGLKLGKRTYFENNYAGNNAKNSNLSVIPPPSVAIAKKVRSPCQNVTTPRCQVEGCNLDLKSAKEYHRKHRVCDSHSKCPKVVVGGLERRFCQQCSRFHSLSEFDEKKRSCRRRLSHHNARRRKPQQETIQFNSSCMSSLVYEGIQQMSFAFDDSPLTQTRHFVNSNCEGAYKSKYVLAKGYLKPEKAGMMDMQSQLPGIEISNAISIPDQDSKKLLRCKGSREALKVTGFKESTLSSNLNGAPDLHQALSLLSTNSGGLCEPGSINFSHSLNATRTGMPQYVTHAISQDSPFVSSNCWQSEAHLADGSMHTVAASSNGASHNQEIQLLTTPYESSFYSNSLH